MELFLKLAKDVRVILIGAFLFLAWRVDRIETRLDILDTRVFDLARELSKAGLK